jgi:NAD(P)-dependent dehydrogenase (short-subunit alcohol dehydrogenase family)
LGKITEEHFDKLFNTNVKGTLFTAQKAPPLLNDGGSIILTGSVASVKGDGNAALSGGSLSIEALMGPVDSRHR